MAGLIKATVVLSTLLAGLGGAQLSNDRWVNPILPGVSAGEWTCDLD